MNARALIAHGGPQRLPTRAAPSLVRALRVARGSPPWTPWTILCRLTGTTLFCNLYWCRRRSLLRPSRRPCRPRHGVITITGIGDHLRLEWPITITGMRIQGGQQGDYQGNQGYPGGQQGGYQGNQAGCPYGQQFDPRQNRCVTAAAAMPSCPAGQQFDQSQNRCVYTLPGGVTVPGQLLGR